MALRSKRQEWHRFLRASEIMLSLCQPQEISSQERTISRFLENLIHLDDDSLVEVP
jgi:hypothetical protein